MPSSWRSSGGAGGDFVLGNSLSGRNLDGAAADAAMAAEEAAERHEELVADQAKTRRDARTAHAMSLVWCWTLACFLLFGIASAFFVSSLYFDPLSGSGAKNMFLEWFDATVDDDEARAEVITALNRLHKHEDGDTGSGGHAELANPAYFLLFLGLPVMCVALLYEVFCRFHEGSPVRAKLMFLRWARAPWRQNASMGKGELFFVLLVVLTNVVVFSISLVSQFQRVTGGWDVDHIPHSTQDGLTPQEVRENGLKAIANAFGYCALISVSFVVMIVARPTTNFFLTDVCGLTHERGRLYYKRIGIWICLATVFHIAFYLRPYASEDVLTKRLLWAFSSSSTSDIKDKNAAAEEDPQVREWLSGRDQYLGWMIFYGEIAAISMMIIAFVTMFAHTIRDKAFELYQFAHGFFGIVVLGCLHMHFDSTVWWLFPFICLLILNIIYTQANHQRPVKVIDFSPLRNGVTRLVLAVSHSFDQSSASNSGLAGRFVFICLPSVRRLQWHALYVASSPTATSDSMTLYIKARGRWSEGVHLHAALCRQKKMFPLVFMDAYHGNYAIDRVMSASYILLVAVGDIHAPYILSVFQELIALYAAHALPQHLKKVVLVWTTDNLCFMKEMEPMLRELQKLDPHEDVFQVRLYLTRQPCEEDLEVFTNRQPLCQFAEKQFAASRIHVRKQPDPFHRSLHSSTVYLIASKIIIFVVTALLLYFVRYQAHRRAFWVLVRLMELGMVALGGLITYSLVYIERRMIRTVMGLADHDNYTPPDAISEEQQQAKHERMVAGGFDIIGTYEYESGIGFVEEYRVQVEAKPPSYAQLVDEMRKQSKHADARADPATLRLKDVCVELAAPSEKARQIVAELREAKHAHKMDVHIEQMRV